MNLMEKQWNIVEAFILDRGKGSNGSGGTEKAGQDNFRQFNAWIFFCSADRLNIDNRLNRAKTPRRLHRRQLTPGGIDVAAPSLS
jgi:hypothetical protein